MSIVKKLSMATAGAAFIVLGVGTTTPASAALLNFSFTTASGGTGSFILDTDTAPDLEPALLFGPDPSSEPDTGFQYQDAISNFSVSTPDVNLSNVTGDFAVFPSVPYTTTPSSGVLSIVGALPNDVDYYYPFQIDVEYSGNISELPTLSADPLSYPRLFAVDRYNATTGEFLSGDRITNFQVVPDPGSILGTVAFGIGGAGLLLKRQLNTKKAAIRY